jgi:hypothetical protein
VVRIKTIWRILAAQTRGTSLWMKCQHIARAMVTEGSIANSSIIRVWFEVIKQCSGDSSSLHRTDIMIGYCKWYYYFRKICISRIVILVRVRDKSVKKTWAQSIGHMTCVKDNWFLVYIPRFKRNKIGLWDCFPLCMCVCLCVCMCIPVTTFEKPDNQSLGNLVGITRRIRPSQQHMQPLKLRL